ncbi:hypothetical protein ACIOEX_29880, partial [Streptomyces sp. NPDC087850]|uniref:hypothetical protein n=1 Tax=Streptomyces sp. NPDC087850 TaxID=3365809 RepID=UPI00383098F4
MEAELAVLAASGATTFVGLVVSEFWTQGRNGLARFLARRRAANATDDPAAVDDVEAELREDGEALARARAAGDGAAASRIEDGWRLRLLDVLRTDPDAAAELRGLLSELAPMVSYTVIGGGANHGPAFQGAHIHGGITFNVQPMVQGGSGARPDQVPSLTVQFSNRTSELALLNEVFGVEGRREGIGLGVLAGLPGVGKSATAWRWADTARELFPDGQVYVDFAALRDSAAGATTGAAGRAARGADVSEALAMVLRALKVSDEYIPASLAERTALYRSHSAGLRMLLVLDDVSRPAQVRPLIPKGPGSAVLVTSQGGLGELVLNGARLISLKPLDAEGGLTLLADRCGPEAVAAERAGAERLVELCGGLPVALQIVAARLLTDPGLTMTSLAEELDDEAGRLAGMSFPESPYTPEETALADPTVFEDPAELAEEYSVSTVFGTSYRLLPPAAARLYRLLGLAPIGTFDVGVAAVAAGLDAASTRRLLASLVAASLLESTRDGRYQMHDLVRLHARERAAREEQPGEERALTERVGTHYLVLTAFADRALRADRLRIADLSASLRAADNPFAAAGGPPPLEWLDIERAAVLAVLRAAARQELHTLAWQLAEAFTALFLHRRYLGAWKESLELGAEAARSAAATATTAGGIAEATEAEARLRSLLSRPLTDLGEYDRARAELETAVARAEVTGHLVLRASVQEFLGRYLDRFDPPRAVEAYRRSLDLNTRAGEARGAAIAAYFLGCALDARGDYAQALASLRGAHRDLLAAPEPDRRMAARAMAAIGAVHEHRGDTGEAVRVLREAAQDL